MATGKKQAKKTGEEAQSTKDKNDGQPKLSARRRVRNAQMNVLDQVDDILTGNCKSASKGNFNCAKFVLDWSGVSDIRTPLAKPLKQKSLADTLLQKLKKTADKPKEAEEDAISK